MSQHPSLRSRAKETIFRSVLKRYERLKDLTEKDKWEEEKSVYGLPKMKIVKFKVKKEKSVEAAEATAEGAAAPAAGAAATGAPAKDGAKSAAKPAAAKPAAKPEAKGK